MLLLGTCKNGPVRIVSPKRFPLLTNSILHHVELLMITFGLTPGEWKRVLTSLRYSDAETGNVRYHTYALICSWQNARAVKWRKPDVFAVFGRPFHGVRVLIGPHTCISS